MKRNRPIILTKDNFIKSIFEYNGYFCEHFPFCFTTIDLSNKWDTIKNDLECQVKKAENSSYPLKISVGKEGLLRRDMFVPNIVSYLNLLFYMEANFNFLQDKCRSEESESSVAKINCFDYPTEYKKSIKNRHYKFIGFKYKLKIDISNCFNSIYTHSLSWAAVGKGTAKKMFLKEIKKSESYIIGDVLDSLNANMNGKQTNGILTGPFTSRICAEFILAEIDRKLKNNKFEFTRYVDDFNFYFYSEDEAKSKIGDIAKILSEYNFIINNTKVEIKKFPFDIIEDYSGIFKIKDKNFDAYAGLNKALQLASDGNIGAIKYYLKILAQIDLSIRNFLCIYSLLINTMITFPLLSPYVVNIISRYKTYFKAKNIRKRLNELLRKEVNEDHEHEVLWLIYILMKLDISIDNETVRRILKSENDMAVIMCLDRLNNNFTLQGFYNIMQVGKFFYNEIEFLNQKLSNQSMLTKNWLLIYTIAKNSLRIDNKIKIWNIKSNKIFKIFEQNDIEFYKSFYKGE